MPSSFVALALAAVLSNASIEWTPSVDAALAQAKRDGKVVFVAINMDHERANDLMVSRHYLDPTIVRLTAHTVNLFASRSPHADGEVSCPRLPGAPPCVAHAAIDKRVRRDFVRAEADGSFIAPQHLFLDGEGRVLHSVPYQITVGELEWCLLTAIRRVEPEFAWTLSPGARAPRRLVADGVDAFGDGDVDRTPPPSREEVQELLARVKRDPSQLRADVAILLRSEEKRALEFVKSHAASLGSASDGRRLGRLLHEIGRTSPAPWWPLVATYLDHDQPSVRREAVVALQQLGVPKSLPKLLARWRKEDDAAVRGDLLRALAAVGATEKKVIGLVLEQGRKAKDESVRAAAVLASGDLEDRESVFELCREALGGDLPAPRAAAACVVAVRRETDLRAQLEEGALLEADRTAKRAFETAIVVLNGGSAALTTPVLSELFEGEIPRDRP